MTINKRLVLTLGLVFVLNSCATAEVPERLSNTATVAETIYCEAPIFRNVEQILVNWIRATVAPAWQPVCADHQQGE